ncbi:MAG: C4-type zinc ribbon domain-containing protein [Myxococcota bacterium]
MRDTLIALYELQQIDSGALEIQRGADRIPQKVKSLEDELEVHRAELGQLNAELDTLRKEQEDLSAHTREETSKHKKWKGRLNDIKSPREYQALSRELELGERAVRDAEERSVELMMNIEAKETVVKQKSEDLRDHEADVNKRVATLVRKQTELRQDVEKASKGRTEVCAKLKPQIVKRYERLRKARQGIGVALVRDGACMGCNMKIRPQQLVEILHFNTMETCPACQRILVHEDLVKQTEREEA